MLTLGKKLDAHVVNNMVLAYPEAIKGYCLWCFESGFKKCMISQDIIFNEIEMAYKLISL